MVWIHGDVKFKTREQMHYFWYARYHPSKEELREWVDDVHSASWLFDKVVHYNSLKMVIDAIEREFKDDVLMHLPRPVEGEDYWIYDTRFEWADRRNSKDIKPKRKVRGCRR